MPDYDNSARTKDRNESRILKDKHQGAAKEGYTAMDRRVRGDQPGYFSTAESADEIERMESEDGFPKGLRLFSDY